MKLQPIVFIIIGVLVLGGLFFLLKPSSPSSPVPTKQTNQTQPSQAMKSNKKEFVLVVKNKKLVSGSDTLSVTEGDEVTIKITADESEELHLHGYDKSVEFEKDQPASLTFTADKTGRFPFELENSKTDLGALEVQPK